MKYISILMVSLFSVTLLYAGEVIPGFIPRFYSIEAATDLPIPAEVAHGQALAGVDISLLEPDSTTNIWNPNKRDIPNHKLLESHARVRFVKELPSRLGQLRFTIEQDGRELIVVLSKKIHNFILRRNILAKLGYNTQPMNWVSEFELEFKNTIDRDIFEAEMRDKLLAGTERWIKGKEDLTFILQDALVLTPESDIYNLTLGVMPESVHQGRRLLKASYVPLALVDTTESINLMPWSAGRLVLDNLKLNHTQDIDTTYNTSFEDARWIARRIGDLTREDLTEIVEKSYFPKAVEKILIEKVIARRNDLLELLKLPEFNKIDFNPEVSFGEDLVRGEITKEFFEGFATRFSYGDPDSPFSAAEIGYLGLSKVQTQIIDTVIGKMNKFLGTQDNENYSNKIMDIIKKEGPFFPVTAVAIPTFHGGMILSRDIVAGSYLGTNNRVQLVDNFGVTLDLGVFAGLEGGPIALGIKGGANLSYQRVYSHIKPVQTLKKSIKEPYKNMLVPFVIRNIGKKIEKLSTVSGDEQNMMLTSVVNELKSAISVGESFIITDSLVPSIFVQNEMSLSAFYFLDPNLLKVNTRIQSAKTLISRFHFHRQSENAFHVYKDSGSGLKLVMSLKLKSYVPIAGIQGRWNRVTAETKFFPVDLSARGASVDVLKSLRVALLSLNIEGLSEHVKPYRVNHKVKEKGNTLQFLIFKRNKTVSDQTMTLHHARGGEERYIQRRYDAITSGRDYESFAVETANELFSIFLDQSYSLSLSPTLNPGFTLAGRAKNRLFMSETDGERVSTSFQRIFNGWQVKPKRLRSILNTVNKEVGDEVFKPLDIINTDKILLYQVQFNYVLTHEGIQKILNSSVREIAHSLKNFSQYRLQDDEISQIAESRFFGLRKIRQQFEKDNDKAMKSFHSWLKGIQGTLTIRGVKELAGHDNMAYQGRIDGFRQGDEAGDSSILSHVYGELPLALQLTPTQKIMQSWGILEGELLLNWMLERAI